MRMHHERKHDRDEDETKTISVNGMQSMKCERPKVWGNQGNATASNERVRERERKVNKSATNYEKANKVRTAGS